MKRAARANINLAALRHNLNRVKQLAPNSKIMAVIKADGYGHGMLRVANALADTDGFAVSCIDEALYLRESAITYPILSLQGYKNERELRYAAEYGVQLVVNNEQQLHLLESIDLPAPVDVWLKVDTGMHRLGFMPEHAGRVYQRLTRLNAVNKPPTLMTHLACADDPQHPMNARQLADFGDAINGLAGKQSIASSGAVLALPHCHRDWVRPGIMLYGSTPLQDGDRSRDDLKTVMTLKAPLISITQARRGDGVGYGGTFECPEDMPVGVVAIGYADGYPRHAPSGTPVMINGRGTQIIGRVSMDMVTIDLRNIDAKLGDEVELWGEAVPVDEVARHVGTISYELLCGVGGRVHFSES